MNDKTVNTFCYYAPAPNTNPHDCVCAHMARLPSYPASTAAWLLPNAYESCDIKRLKHMLVAAYMRTFCVPRRIWKLPQTTKNSLNPLCSRLRKRRLQRCDYPPCQNYTVTKDTAKNITKNKKMRNFICTNLLKNPPQKRIVFAADLQIILQNILQIIWIFTVLIEFDFI